MATWHYEFNVTIARGVNEVGGLSADPLKVGVKYPGSGRVKPAYRGVFAYTSEQPLETDGSTIESVIMEAQIWYPIQIFDTSVLNTDTQFYIIVGSKASGVGESVQIWSYY